MSGESRARVVAGRAVLVYDDDAEVIEALIRRGLRARPRPSADVFDVAARVLADLAAVTGSVCGNLASVCGSSVDVDDGHVEDGGHAFISVAEAALRLGVTSSRVRERLRDERDMLTGHKVQGKKLWRVDASSIESRPR